MPKALLVFLEIEVPQHRIRIRQKGAELFYDLPLLIAHWIVVRQTSAVRTDPYKIAAHPNQMTAN